MQDGGRLAIVSDHPLHRQRQLFKMLPDIFTVRSQLAPVFRDLRSMLLDDQPEKSVFHIAAVRIKCRFQCDPPPLEMIQFVFRFMKKTCLSHQ